MRDFLKHTLATLLGLFIFLGFSVGGLVLLIIAASTTASRDTTPSVRDKSMLVFDLSQTITDAPPNSSTRDVLNDALAGNPPNTVSLKTVLNTIEAAAKDSRIRGIYLYSGNSSGGTTTGYATLREVRRALERFKAAGKKIYAYDVDWQEREYYLASIANTIAINPMGQLTVNGLSSEGVFFGSALRKFGIGVQVTKVGKYKSAVEPFILSKRSRASQQQTQALLSDLWNEFLATTSQSRKLTPEQLRDISDDAGFLNANEALQRKLVDRIAYADEVIASLKEETGEDKDSKSFRQISLKNYARVAQAKLEQKDSKNTIAIVYAEGDIVNGQGNASEVGGDRLARQLRELRLDKDVKAVVLRVNSPGGSATASDIIQREAILTRKAKPLIVSMGNIAASGGYWISTYADRIFAEPNTITGSIGVFGIQPNIQKLANQNGITWDVVKTGKFADSLTLSRPKTREELAIAQRSVNRIYDQFLVKVSESRKLEKSEVAKIAQGRVWSGNQAKSIGLVDQIGGLDDAIAEAAKRAKLEEDWQVEEFPKTRSLEERILERLMGSSIEEMATPSDPVTTEMKKFQENLVSLRSLNDPQGIYLRLPINLRID
jgi:protease-4